MTVPAAPCGAAVVQPAPCSVLVLDTRLACPAQLGGTDNAPIDDARLRPAASGAAPRPAAIGASPTAASAAPAPIGPRPQALLEGGFLGSRKKTTAGQP